MTPLHSGKSGLSCTTSVGPAQYMREEMLTPSPPPNWGQNFAAQVERGTNEMEFKDEVGRERELGKGRRRWHGACVYVLICHVCVCDEVECSCWKAFVGERRDIPGCNLLLPFQLNSSVVYRLQSIMYSIP